MSVINQSVTYPGLTNVLPDPYDPALWPNNDTRTTILNVIATNPTGVDIIGSIEQISAATDGFTEGSAAAVIGEKFYICIVAKNDGLPVNEVRFRISDSVGFLASALINLDTGLEVGSSSVVFNVSYLSDGYKLIQGEWTATRTDAALQGQIFMWNDANGGIPDTGSKMNAQATFFGKATGFPASVLTGIESVKSTVKTSIRSTIRNTNTF